MQTCSQVTGLVVVIDVIRAFTTAAYAFGAGAKSITLVSTVDEALKLRKKRPGSFIMGEVNGLPPESFDLGNSPSKLINADLKDRYIIQRTSNGTQGVVKCANASTLLASSFCCAQATADYIKKIDPEIITFVNTGVRPGEHGDEDLAYSDYLEALLTDGNPVPEHYLKRVSESSAARYFFEPFNPLLPWQDIECCTKLDCFDFAMRISREDKLLVMKPIKQFSNI